MSQQLSWKHNTSLAYLNTTPPFEGGPFRLYQAYLESDQTLHEIEAWSTHRQLVHLC
jgi:hypothetical protein